MSVLRGRIRSVESRNQCTKLPISCASTAFQQVAGNYPVQLGVGLTTAILSLKSEVDCRKTFKGYTFEFSSEEFLIFR